MPQKVTQGNIVSNLTFLSRNPLIFKGFSSCPPITHPYRTHLLFSSFVSRHSLNEGLHPVCALLAHRFRDMTVTIQGKSRRIMPHVFLNRLDVVPCADGINCESVATIMQTMMLQAGIFKCLLEGFPDRRLRYQCCNNGTCRNIAYYRAEVERPKPECNLNAIVNVIGVFRGFSKLSLIVLSPYKIRALGASVVRDFPLGTASSPVSRTSENP